MQSNLTNQPTSTSKTPLKTSADVIIVGAGIQGAGIAQACAVQGWRVCAVERNSAPGLETSSASSKLIHGGLRYLETLQLKLVYECLRERKLLLKNAPHLVHMSPFYIPVYKTSVRKPWWIFIGLIVYAVLGGLNANCWFRRVPKKDWPDLNIEQEDLIAVFQYYDAQTDDNAITRSVLASAQSFGVQVQFNTRLESVGFANGQYQVQTATGIVEAPCLINAAGPWVNQCAKFIPGAPLTNFDWVQGVHIVLPVSCGPGCFYLESITDGRPMFVLPWKGKTLVGTTERILKTATAQATDVEVEYLLATYNAYFPVARVAKNDVESVMAGVRVLPLAGDKVANQRQRETVFTKRVADDSIYLGVYGGKLTSYRAMSEKVVALIAPVLKKALTSNNAGKGNGNSRALVSTRNIPLPKI